MLSFFPSLLSFNISPSAPLARKEAEQSAPPSEGLEQSGGKGHVFWEAKTAIVSVFPSGNLRQRHQV
jgi:hypothetical protein